MSEVKALHPIGKTQWAKWGDEAREAYNHMRNLGFTHETGVAEADAVQAKVRRAALAELALLGQEQDAEGVTPPAADEVVAGPSPTASAPKKPRAPRKKKA
jgi:hypothetical protein